MIYSVWVRFCWNLCIFRFMNFREHFVYFLAGIFGDLKPFYVLLTLFFFFLANRHFYHRPRTRMCTSSTRFTTSNWCATQQIHIEPKCSLDKNKARAEQNIHPNRCASMNLRIHESSAQKATFILIVYKQMNSSGNLISSNANYQT